MKYVAFVVLLFALPLAALVAGYAHALGAGSLVEAATFVGMAALLFFAGIKTIDAAGSGERVPRLPRKDQAPNN
jgi:hypothetical protein